MALLAEAFSSWAALGWAALMYGPVLLGTVLIHELGHALAARRVGGHADGILLWPLGGLAFVGHDCGPKGEPAPAAGRRSPRGTRLLPALPRTPRPRARPRPLRAALLQPTCG